MSTPILPIAPAAYDKAYFDQLHRVLTLYFNQLYSSPNINGVLTADGLIVLGDVGIGVTPTQSLQIERQTVAGGNNYILFRKTDQGVGQGCFIGMAANSNDLKLMAHAANAITFHTSTSDTQRASIDATGLTVDLSGVGQAHQITTAGVSSTTKARLGQFADGTRLSSNYYYTGTQNADSAALGGAVVTLQSAATNTSQILFSIAAAGTPLPTLVATISSSGLAVTGGVSTSGSAVPLYIAPNATYTSPIFKMAANNDANKGFRVKAGNNGGQLYAMNSVAPILSLGVSFDDATITDIATISSTGLAVTGVVKTNPLTVATLPAAGTAGAGARSFVTDANATTFAAVVAGGGANGVPVYSDGTNWRIG